MKHFTLAAALLGAIALAPSAHAQDFGQLLEDIEVNSTLDTVSEYVFRGVSLGSGSVQPGTSLSLGGLTVGSWYSAGFGEDSAVQSDELDLYASYSLPLEGPISVSGGITYYFFPQAGDFLETDGGSTGSFEVNGNIGLNDVPLSPNVTAYYDFNLESLTLEGNVSHSFDLPRDGWSANLGLTVGHVDLDGETFFSDATKPFDNYQWGTATVSANKAITDDISFYVSGNFTANSESSALDFNQVTAADGSVFADRDDSTLFWFGTGISVNY